jgi:phytol kinase
LDAEALLVQLGAVVALATTGLWLRRRTTLDESAMMGAALVAYASWALGGWRWLVPPVLMFLIYIALSPRSERDGRGVSIHGLACVTSTGLLWLFLYSSLGPDYYGPYVLAFAAHLAIMGVSRLQRSVPWLTLLATIVATVLVSWLSFFLPYVAMEGWSPTTMQHFLLAPVAIGLAALCFAWMQPNLDDCPTDALRWLRQAAIVAGVSTLPMLFSSSFPTS